MRQAVSLLATMLLAMVIFTSTIETGLAEPQKNQIPVTVTCDNGMKYRLVFNGEGNAGHVTYVGPNNIIPKSYLVIYFQAGTKTEIARDEFRQGNRTGQGDLIHCTGSTTTEISGLGTVDAVFDFYGLVTPRST
jgi:hypothetical protein